MSKPYSPPYSLTSAIVSLVARIGEAVGRLSAHQAAATSLRLRRINRIRTIQGSLAIEQYSGRELRMLRVEFTFFILNSRPHYVNSLGAYMQKVFQWLRENSEPWAHWATVLTLMAVCFGGYQAYAQLELVNEQRRWQNFNDMNVRYADLYRNIPPEIASGCRLDDFEKLEPETKIWVRQFFDLYSEEYWLYSNELIPEEMWTHRISSGVRVNLNTYPAIIDGYYYWAARNSFTHPDKFRSEVESAIDDAKHLPQNTK